MQKPIPVPSILETQQLPDFDYLGLDRIIVPITADDFNAAVANITAAKLVGFDTESSPVFEKGATSDGPHIVQFACKQQTYIFQLCNPQSHNPLLYVLASDEIKKVGFDLASDRKLLRNRYGILVEGLIDICPLFKKQGYRNTVGVRAAVAIVFAQKFQKSRQVTMSNWRSPTLSSRQLLYAGNDAFAALQVYLQLHNAAK